MSGGAAEVQGESHGPEGAMRVLAIGWLMVWMTVMGVSAAGWAADRPSLLPRPESVTWKDEAGAFRITDKTPLVVNGDAALSRVARMANLGIQARTGLELDLREGVPKGAPGAVTIAVPMPATLRGEDDFDPGREGYVLQVDSRGVRIGAATVRGAFYGVQTMLQLLRRDPREARVAWGLPAVLIRDRPRFAWRGMMLDVCRHFWGKAEVKRFLDLMAMHKFNTFHWHLSDDQGWRIEIRRYPKLTEVGAWRPESPVPGHRDQGDGKRHGGFYTQADVREIVAYAAERFITVVPEIEMPGHASAALASYPELGNKDIPDYAPRVQTRWGVHSYTFSPRNETFTFLEGVLDEVCGLFPGPYLHVGGDEAPKDQWMASPAARQVMRREGLADGEALQGWFVRRIEKHVNRRGRKLIGWDEIQEGGLSPTATMMVWRDEKWARHAVERGNPVVMAPTTFTYFDYSPGKRPDQPFFEVIGGDVPIEKVYSFDPIPAGLEPARQRLVLGCQAQLWGEYMFTWAKVEYMAFPRTCALAEVAWSPQGARDWNDFRRRLDGHLPRLDALKVNYRRMDGTPAHP